MKCLVCKLKISPGDNFFLGTEVLCDDEDSWRYSDTLNGYNGGIHIACMPEIGHIKQLGNDIRSNTGNSVVERTRAVDLLE